MTTMKKEDFDATVESTWKVILSDKYDWNENEQLNRFEFVGGEGNQIGAYGWLLMAFRVNPNDLIAQIEVKESTSVFYHYIDKVAVKKGLNPKEIDKHYWEKYEWALFLEDVYKIRFGFLFDFDVVY